MCPCARAGVGEKGEGCKGFDPQELIRVRHFVLRNTSTGQFNCICLGSGAKTAGRKRSTPDTGTKPVPFSRALTLQIPSGASPASDARTTPHSRPMPSPLPLLTPAAPTPPKATLIHSTGTTRDQTPSAGKRVDGGKPGDNAVGSSSDMGPMSWGAWGDWDLRSPSSEVPRTPVPLNPDVSPMALGAPAEEQVLRRRNTPFDLR